MIEAAAATISQLLQEQAITLELALPHTAPLIFVDRDRIMQVLLNLLTNAIKFCDPVAGWIQVSLTVEDEVLCVAVTDNGSGIPLEEQKTIFDKFHQVNDTRHGKPQGTGLGLPISAQIVAHYGGQLWVESTPGAGATFLFTLPLQIVGHR